MKSWTLEQERIDLVIPDLVLRAQYADSRYEPTGGPTARKIPTKFNVDAFIETLLWLAHPAQHAPREFNGFPNIRLIEYKHERIEPP